MAQLPVHVKKCQIVEVNSILFTCTISKYKVSEIMKWFNKSKSCGILRAMAMNKPNKKYNDLKWSFYIWDYLAN